MAFTDETLNLDHVLDNISGFVHSARRVWSSYSDLGALHYLQELRRRAACSIAVDDGDEVVGVVAPAELGRVGIDILRCRQFRQREGEHDVSASPC
jgi:hypothetical protein